MPTGEGGMGNERPTLRANAAVRPHSPLAFPIGSIVARHRLDGVDDLLVGHLFAGAQETGVATIHEDGAIALRVAAQGVDQLPPFGVVQGTEVHGNNSFCKTRGQRNSGHAAVSSGTIQAWEANSARSRYTLRSTQP